MKKPHITAMFVIAASLMASQANAQIAGSTTIGVETTKMEIVTAGWSAKRQVMGATVYNEGGEPVGKIDDVIIAPGSMVSTVIIGAGGFVGLKRHEVAIPVTQLQQHDGTFVLPGATKAAIKALPVFEYAKPVHSQVKRDSAQDAPSKAESSTPEPADPGASASHA